MTKTKIFKEKNVYYPQKVIIRLTTDFSAKYGKQKTIERYLPSTEINQSLSYMSIYTQ